MNIIFKHIEGDRSEIESVLLRLEAGDDRGNWSARPDEIVVERRLAGGRSGAEVLEIEVAWGNQRSRKIAKIAPLHELEREWDAFHNVLRNPSAVFAPIEATTPGLRRASERRPGDREAVIYDHVARFVGDPETHPQTLEEVAAQALGGDLAPLERAIRAIDGLFRAARNDLYERYRVDRAETTVLGWVNERLGPDLVVEVDRHRRTTSFSFRGLTSGTPSADTMAAARRYRADVLEASSKQDSSTQPGQMVYLPRLQASWWGPRLMGREGGASIEVTGGGREISAIARASVRDGDLFDLYGRVRSTRFSLHRERLLTDGELRQDDDGLVADRTSVDDPFRRLFAILNERRPDRVTSVVHGDLNPRNVLLVGDQPCLIDYNLTRDGQPILGDFARLEGSLAREVLPASWSWADLVRLQRLLAVASRFGDAAADRLGGMLERRHPELAPAFRLFWTIRRCARDVYPSEGGGPWWREHLAQLYLFAHLTWKWPGQPRQAVRVSAAVAGVASEVLSGRSRSYRRWSTRSCCRRYRHSSSRSSATRSASSRSWPLSRARWTGAGWPTRSCWRAWNRPGRCSRGERWSSRPGRSSAVSARTTTSSSA
jgi:Ternary complex associated domain 9